MTFDRHFFARAFEVLFPLAFAAFVLLKRSTTFPTWAKGLAIGAAITGLVVAALEFLLPHYRELGLTADSYLMLTRLKHQLVGFVGGIGVSILIACGRLKRRESGERVHRNVSARLDWDEHPKSLR